MIVDIKKLTKTFTDGSKKLHVLKDINLQIDKGKKKIVTFIIGGPNKYYNYSDEQIHYTFNI